MDLMAQLKNLLSPQQQEKKGPSSGGMNGQIDAAKAGAQDANNPAGAKTPEMKYEEIWGQEVKPLVNQAPVFSMDQEKFSQAVAGMDFTKSIPPELMQKALAGDAQSLMGLLNRVGQNAFSAATISSRDMVEHANKKAGGSFEQQVKEAVRVALSEQNLTKANAAFNDPLVTPLLREINNRIRAKFPEASPEELAKQSQQMLMQIATKIVSGSPEEVARQKQEVEQKEQKVKSQDWEAWATAGVQTQNEGADFLNSVLSGGQSQQ